MANLVLTERCNKNCSYCFAKDKSNNEDMTFEQAKFIIDTLWGKEYFKLLGGEPTIAKEFRHVVDYLVYKISITKENPESSDERYEDYTSSFVIISNMLFDEDTSAFLQEYLKYGADIRFLANATELEVGNRFSIFERNIRNLLEFGCEEFCFSITVDDSKSLEYHKDYIKKLVESFPEVCLYRLSAPFPDGNTISNPIGNLPLGEKIYEIFKILIENKKRAHMDCQTLPCMFTPEQYGYIKSFSSRNLRAKCPLTSGALDIYPDGHCIRCYPSSSIRTKATKNPKDLLFARENIANQCNKIKNPFIQQCQECLYYELDLCAGPCFGYITCKDCGVHHV